MELLSTPSRHSKQYCLTALKDFKTNVFLFKNLLLNVKLKFSQVKYGFFFRGQIETPAKSLGSLIINEDTEVLVAINSTGLYVLDPVSKGPDSVIIGLGSESPFIYLFISRTKYLHISKYLYISR